ncbi:MAG: DUF1501 domain-containing protein [Verrucomicrobia bacterium]|nr:DUF1501 domain-containing protein [Verrucomicrobiota bacterium]
MPADRRRHHCGRFGDQPQSRREMLQWCAHGFGAVALSALSQGAAPLPDERPLAPKPPQFPPRAKSVIFLYMDGGPSQVDMFDPKPLLKKYHGQDPRKVIGDLTPTQFGKEGTLFASPWEFKQHGDSGHWISSLLPHLSEVADELAIIRSMKVHSAEHTSANYFLHTGSVFQGNPSMGAWFGYGLGSENENLPGFVVVKGRKILTGGLNNFGSGFLPATYQGSLLLPRKEAIANIAPLEAEPALQRSKLDLIRTFDRQMNQGHGNEPAVEAAIQNYETAFRMQTAVPELMELESESPETMSLYGLDSDFEPLKTFATQCLVARRMVERGVRFVELVCNGATEDRWDQHGALQKSLPENCRSMDQPIAALIKDLKRSGLLDSTLLVWAGEFGRTPFAQGKDGRDHNPDGFTVWMAGGGIKGGVSVGATDEWGYRAAERPIEIHDLHATMLHLMGIDHTTSTFRFSGRDMRLTDVYGNVIEEVLA